MILRNGFILVLILLYGFSFSQEPADFVRSIVESGWFDEHESQSLQQIYETRQYQLLWFSRQKPTDAALELQEIVINSEDWGLDPGRLHKFWLGSLRRVAKEDIAVLDVLLTSAFLRISADLSYGRLEPQKTDPHWHFSDRRVENESAPNVESLIQHPGVGAYFKSLEPAQQSFLRLKDALTVQRMAATQGVDLQIPLRQKESEFNAGELPPEVLRYLRATGDLQETGGSGRMALKRFQSRHGLQPNGILNESTIRELNVPLNQRVQEIVVNIERWRWLPRKEETTFIYINIADFHLHFIREGTCELSMKVVVGRSSRPTPSFRSDLVAIEVNPDWRVPTRIAREDLLPDLRRNPETLTENGFLFFNAETGEPIEPFAVDWAEIPLKPFPYIMVQKAGETNALGKLKFWIPNPYGIFLHDTPAKNLFEVDRRMFSSGCIRLEKPLDLAKLVLKDNAFGYPEYFEKDLESGENARLTLKTSIPVYLLYWTSWVDQNGLLQFRSDIYGRNQELQKKLVRSSPQEIAR